ncbi:DMT family transporter [Sediminitomix flava]|uniref:Small multidrug resistance pump n=1 Tax=Sediminitomix flava TaxID=379075 RepID=A0A315ZDP7_SEDFL|nr:multidrug efflux SMR transporter [Sediminitomix flava]PWJ43239.1 small multidrug resistance pump [Sediminitomix flava]
MKWFFLCIAILTEVIATSALKSSEGFTKLTPSLVVVIGYSLAFYFLSLALKNMSVGIAYAIWSGAGTVLIALVGYFYYKQELDFAAILGLSLIVIGVLVINLFSNSVSH